ncbi:MAG: phosphate ABC transporter substrate-binding protein [Candidatus Cloacimonetes bacterium]|nr:phosphate ABC transporter substrate-binding protein [Candidatus Cloacimonadota bacterium]MCF7814039.1 phosphate ABC transporter substrate-binding protein [Candidatus Cloacimonadota bacterium]MCF7868057.1 phosphate ABC transporter substrate-binding protein [Candidatus Cloacimonadota bacterium]MCF7883480.1 phosphate ABC transporter substrate-binding protein [Candidatus Cloacimonadota bacterium]
MILKKLLILILAGVAVLVLVLACSQKSTTINTAGSTTILPIVQAAAEAYMDKNPEINISVRGGGSSIGIKSAINQTIDIGNASRRITNKEADLVEEKDSDLIETAIAKDAISIVVHKNNPLTNLSMQELKSIYSGKINNWKEIGGKDMEIIVISRDVSSGSFLVFNEVVLDSSQVKENSMRLASNNAVATTVSYTPGAIGYIGLGYVNDELKTLSIDGVFPNNETAQSNEYRLTRLLYMYTSSQPRKPALEFIDYILSEEGQKSVEEQGYVRIK